MTPVSGSARSDPPSSPKKLLLLGANGQVGHELLVALSPLGEVMPATRDGRLADGSTCLVADLADAASLRAALHDANADVIVNAAAYTAVDRAEDEPELAERVNHHAVGAIGVWAAQRDAQVVHYSTDYVFDGVSTRPYREADVTTPLGVYGATKLDGERALAASGAEHLIFRTAWVYAARGYNFLRTMLRLARERDEVRIVADQIGAPTPAAWIADATARAIARSCGTNAHSRQAARGIFHLVASGHCSWFDFANAIFAGAVQRGLIARAPRVVPITTADYPTRARRPAYSVLDSARLKKAFALELPDWRAGLDDVLDALAAAAQET